MKTNNVAPTERTESASTQGRTNSPHRILVVDDDGGIRHLNAEVLIHSGYEVDAAADGAAAWQTLNADSYDLLIADHNMPNASGPESGAVRCWFPTGTWAHSTWRCDGSKRSASLSARSLNCPNSRHPSQGTLPPARRQSSANFSLARAVTALARGRTRTAPTERDPTRQTKQEGNNHHE